MKTLRRSLWHVKDAFLDFVEILRTFFYCVLAVCVFVGVEALFR